MQIRKQKLKIEKQLLALFPSLPKLKITAYLQHHPSLNAVDFVVHFLEIAEPTKKKLDFETEMLLAQARQISLHQKSQEKEEQNTEEPPINPEEAEQIKEKQKLVNTFEISDNDTKLANKLFQSLIRFRMQKKRSRFQDEDYLNRMSFAYAQELGNGYISLDSEEWNEWFRSHPDYSILTDLKFCCGLVVDVANPIQSVISMIENDSDMRQIALSSVRFCGIGVFMSRNRSMFFCLFAANRK